ncbi:MAG: hypothetical protein U5K30_07530 [Acidimicrobiales bacterium]|nr:hypothetical protein [Acidimicrobiales bacterium]
MRIRRILLAFVAPLLLLAACGSDDPDVTAAEGADVTAAEGADVTTAEPVHALADAATAYEDAGSSRMSMTMTMTGIPEMGDVTIEAEGAFDAEGRGFMTMDFGAMFEAMPEAESAPFDLGDGQMEIRVLDDAAYMRFPLFSMLLGEGVEWIRMPVEDYASGANGMSPVPGGDPLDMLRVLGGGEDIETVGTEDVRGANTTHYRGTFDLDDAAKSLPAEQRAAFEDATASFGDVPALPVDVWLGDDGLVRRFSTAIDGDAFGAMIPTGGAGGTGAGEFGMEIVMEIYDYGAELEPVEAPTNAVDAEDLGMTGGFGG